MSNPDKDELEYQRQVTEQLNNDIRLGKDLAKLRKLPEFKRVFDQLFITNGKKFLWENIIHIEEEQMMKRREKAELDRGVKTLAGLKRQVDARLVFEAFLNTIEYDYENAVEAQSEIEAEEA